MPQNENQSDSPVKSRPRYFLQYFFPGSVLILCAFWAGMLTHMILALAGFLSFFVLGVTLMIEGAKKCRGGSHEERS